MVYSPEEDSFFLAEQLKEYLEDSKNKDIKILDLGTGSGILAETAFESGIKRKNILAADIDEEAVKKASKKGIKAVQTDLFSNIEGKFDLIVFNPPYLPENRHDKKEDTSGGKKGDETILRFLKQVKRHLAEKGKILLLLSSFTPRKDIEKEIKKQNLHKEKIAEKKLFYETLEIWLLQS